MITCLNVDELTNKKFKSFKIIQNIFRKKSFLIHFQTEKPLFIDVDTSKKKT